MTDTTATLPARIPADDLPILLERYRQGADLVDLAAEYGVTKSALYKRLDRYCLAGKGDLTLHDAVTDYLTDRLCTAMEEQELAQDALSIARTRDTSANWKWVTERRRPKLFAQKQELQIDQTVQVILNKPQPVVVNAPAIEVSSEVIDNRSEIKQ